MQTPLQIVFRNVHRSEAVAEKVRQRVQWLERHGEEHGHSLEIERHRAALAGLAARAFG